MEPEPEKITVTRRERVEDALPPGGRFSAGQFSAGGFGCLGAMLIWTLGWVAVAYAAISRAWRGGDGWALIGAVVSGLVAFIGVRISMRLVRGGGTGGGLMMFGSVSMPRRVTGWVTAVGWFAMAVMWNVGVFAALFKWALGGRGGMIVLALGFSLLGLLFLFIMLTGIGVVIDSRRRGRDGNE